MEEKRLVILSLGSNLNDPVNNIKLAFERISALDHIQDMQASQLYLSSPVGNRDQSDFINAICLFTTSLPLIILGEKLQQIESLIGKQRNSVRNAPRVIDIDIVFYGEEKIETGPFLIPHPRWNERLFVLMPLLELMEVVRCGGESWLLRPLIEEIKNQGDQMCQPLFIS